MIFTPPFPCWNPTSIYKYQAEKKYMETFQIGYVDQGHTIKYFGYVTGQLSN